MVTNVQINTVDNCAIIYFQDGTTEVVDPQSQKQLQLPELGFCTISEAKPIEEGEHPEDQIPDFAKKLLKFWQDFWHALKVTIQDPTATPHEE